MPIGSEIHADLLAAFGATPELLLQHAEISEKYTMDQVLTQEKSASGLMCLVLSDFLSL